MKVSGGWRMADGEEAMPSFHPYTAEKRSAFLAVNRKLHAKASNPSASLRGFVQRRRS
jgi:hypothetical protein